MMEKLLGWKGAISINRMERQNDDMNLLLDQLNRGEGAFVICSHLGNMEMLRAFTEFDGYLTQKKFEVFPIVDLSGTTKFNSLLRELNPELIDKIIDANSVGVDSAVWMMDKIKEGNLVVIAGDRTSANSRDRNLVANFLGESANFPEGTFSLAGILKAPVYFIFAVRKKDFNIHSTYESNLMKF